MTFNFSPAPPVIPDEESRTEFGRKTSGDFTHSSPVSSAPEIIAARQAELRKKTPRPAPAPVLASAERIDQEPTLGSIQLVNSDGRIGFDYRPSQSSGEHTDVMSFAFVCEGRQWVTTVRIIQRDSGAVSPNDNCMGTGRAIEIALANR